MYQALYRAYRPEVFDEILGQKHIVRILQNQIAKDEIGHAYLLCGTRGTGKTTTARILAKAVNCLSEAVRQLHSHQKRHLYRCNRDRRRIKQRR